MIILIFCIFAIITIGIAAVWHKKPEINWIEITIEKALHEKGLELIDIINPGNERGPFPAFTKNDFSSGEKPLKVYYRIVKLRDEENEIIEYWVKVYKNGNLEWRMPLD